MAKVFARKYMRNGLPKEKLEEKPWQLRIFINADNKVASIMQVVSVDFLNAKEHQASKLAGY